MALNFITCKVDFYWHEFESDKASYLVKLMNKFDGYVSNFELLNHNRRIFITPDTNGTTKQ